MGFNQRKPPDRTVCVAVDLLAAFDTVCHNKLLSKINRSPLPPATSRWLSSYLRGRQAKTCFRGVKSSSRKVHLRNTNYRNIQYTQNEALRISTGCHKMSSVDHLHAEATMLKVKEHSELLSTQYLARCLEPENVNFSITTREPTP